MKWRWLQARVAVNENRHDTPRESLLYAQHAGGRHHRRLIVADQDASARRVFRERGKVLWLVLAEWIKSTMRRLHYSQDVKKYRLQFAQESDRSRTVSDLSLSSICDLWTYPLLSGHHQSCQSSEISFTNDECSMTTRVSFIVFWEYAVWDYSWKITYITHTYQRDCYMIFGYWKVLHFTLHWDYIGIIWFNYAYLSIVHDWKSCIPFNVTFCFV